jgi:F-type H+-transporting ATPase subunit a
MNFLQITQPIPELYSNVVFHIGRLPVTNSMTSTWLAIVLVFVFVFFLRKHLHIFSKSKIQTCFEVIIESVVGLLDQVTNNRERSEKLFSIIASIFLFFLLSNIITLIPGLTSININGVALFRTATTDFNTTLSLAVFVVFLSQLASIRSYGFFAHIGEYVQFKKVFLGFKESIGQGFLAIINFIMGLLDIIGEFAKIISLSLRLFGNMFAGEVLMVVIMSFLSFIAPSLLIAQTLLIGGLQAMVFSVLSAVYLNLALGENNDSESQVNSIINN